VLVSSLALLVRRGRVGFRLIVLALRMLMRRLMMVMGRLSERRQRSGDDRRPDAWSIEPSDIPSLGYGL
jgi:hypothetical protein